MIRRLIGSLRPNPPTVLDGLLLALTLMSGYMDAVSYLALDAVFVANMTGNLVLLGLAVARAAGEKTLWSAMAFVGFAIGAGTGGRVVGLGHGAVEWPRRVTVALAVEVIMLACFAAGWFTTGGRPAGGWIGALVIVASAAMGLQSAAARTLGVSGVTTTYVTGTLTTLMTDLFALSGTPTSWVRLTSVLLVLVIGAVLGATCLRIWPAGAGLPPALLLLAVTVIASRAYHPSGHRITRIQWDPGSESLVEVVESDAEE